MSMNWTEDEYQTYLARRKAEKEEKARKKAEALFDIQIDAEIEMYNNTKPDSIHFTVPLKPVTKKNHSRIITVGKYPKLLPSEAYEKYDRAIAPYLREFHNQIGETIGYPINLECHFYCDTHRQSDLVGHLQSIQDLLVKYKCLEDDCRDIVASTNGSVVLYDKENSRTEIIITVKEGYEQWAKKRKSSK